MKYICRICNIEFQAKPSDKRKYCSFKCRDIDYKIRFGGKNSSFYRGDRIKTFQCKKCGKTFDDYISNKRIYCSTGCGSADKLGEQGKNWRGGVSPGYEKYVGQFTEELKQQVRARDKVCVGCGATTKLQIHHKDFNPKNSVLDNLELVCKVCHGKRHYKSLAEYYAVFPKASKSSLNN